MASLLTKIHYWTSVAPLLAAIFAPFSILFDIPALTEPWFIHDSDFARGPHAVQGIPDPPGSIVLSAIGLGFNVFANALLLVRFSTSAQWWRVATRVSLVFWISKVIMAIVNLAVFGRPHPGTRRGEGLWCAVVSLIICGMITVLLLVHWTSDLDKARRNRELNTEQLALRVAGRHFMLNVTFFVIDLGLFALIASQVERWTYLDGIYFTTVTYLTIGFGEFNPTHPVTRVLLFFFALIGIAQIGNLVGMLVEFFSSRSAAKRAASRKKYEHRMQDKENRQGMKPDLVKEMEFLHRLSEKEEARTRTIQLVKSLLGLLVFWIVGGVIFSQLEGWGFGTGMYFAYISFLTIGYGDYVPVTPAGRVVFVLYAMIAVPIMASFAVQAVQQVFSAFSAQQYHKTKAKKGLELDIEQRHSQGTNRINIATHAEFVEKWHRDWEEHVRGREAEGSNEDGAHELASRDQETHDDVSTRGEEAQEEQEREFNEDARLAEKVLELALSLEWRARKLLIMRLNANGNQHGTMRTAKILLTADRNVQLQEVKGLLREIEDDRADEKFDTDANTQRPTVRGARSATILQHVMQDDLTATETLTHTDGHETLREVKRYREDFAGLLAAGSRLMRLKGKEKALFERRSLGRELQVEER